MAITGTELTERQAVGSGRTPVGGLLTVAVGLVVAILSLGWWRERGVRTDVDGANGAQVGTENLVLRPQWLGVIAGAALVGYGVHRLLRRRRSTLLRPFWLAGCAAFAVSGVAWLATFVSLGTGGSWSDGRPLRNRRRELDLPALPGASNVCTPARVWLEAARHEQSSSHTFARLGDDLAAMGAPAHLVRRCRKARDEEARHRHLCVAIARLHGGRWIQGPSRSWKPTSRPTRPSHARLAVEALVDGMVAEAFAVERLRLGIATVEDRQRELMERLRCEEADHVRLARETVEWCLALGGNRVRRSLAAAAAGLPKRPDYPAELRALSTDELHAAGLVTEAEARQAWNVAIRRARTQLQELFYGPEMALAA